MHNIHVHIPAHVDVSLFVANYIPDLFHVILQEMGDVYLVVLVPGEGGVQFGERPVGHPFGELLLVEVVFGLLSAAEVQYGIAYGFVALPHVPALLNEAPEWRQTSARTYHYDGRLRFGRQSELRATYENRNQHFVAIITPRQLSLQPIGGHSLIHAISARLILDHNGRHVNRIGMRRRDGVVSRLQSRQQFQQMIQRWLHGRQVLQNVDNRATILDHPLGVQLFALIGGRTDLLEESLVLFVRRVFRDFFQHMSSGSTRDVGVELLQRKHFIQIHFQQLSDAFDQIGVVLGIDGHMISGLISGQTVGQHRVKSSHFSVKYFVIRDSVVVVIGDEFVLSGTDFLSGLQIEFHLDVTSYAIKCILRVVISQSQLVDPGGAQLLEPHVQICATVLEPFVKLLCVISGISLTIRGHREHGDRVLDFSQLRELLHIALFGVGDHRFHTITRGLFGQTGGKLFGGSRLGAIKHDHISALFWQLITITKHIVIKVNSLNTNPRLHFANKTRFRDTSRERRPICESLRPRNH
ncbi:unnamed protein product [Oppiella nova]|uniref:Uncharacterized protein n=1 Tax=Oppiella nova TaxID=334625 RepID=A0A7R9QTW7_9ACAR|nr:unnamed protein product [Oppiella nova]CAG2174761.1 unnamed protein product [Oppiella nova]